MQIHCTLNMKWFGDFIIGIIQKPTSSLRNSASFWAAWTKKWRKWPRTMCLLQERASNSLNPEALGAVALKIAMCITLILPCITYRRNISVKEGRIIEYWQLGMHNIFATHRLQASFWNGILNETQVLIGWGDVTKLIRFDVSNRVERTPTITDEEKPHYVSGANRRLLFCKDCLDIIYFIYIVFSKPQPKVNI